MAELRRVTYTDSDGRKKVVLLPSGASDEEAPLGVPVGPPDLSDLGLPLDTEVRLNNELFYRAILTPQDAMRRRQDILSAIQTTLKLDTEKVFRVYVGGENSNVRTAVVPQEQVNSTGRPRPRTTRPRRR